MNNKAYLAIASAMAAVFVWAGTAVALDKCKATLQSSDGTIYISAIGITGNLLWGNEAGEETNAVADSGCVVDGSAKKCTMGAQGTAARITPPQLCTLYLKDDGDSKTCSAYIKKCTPGTRSEQETRDALCAIVATNSLLPPPSFCPQPPPPIEQLVATTCWGMDALPTHQHGQSFTATGDGKIAQIDMVLQVEPTDGSTQISLAIYEGAGYGGAMLYSQLVTPSYGYTSSPTPIESFPLSTPVPVVEGNVYTIGLAKNNPAGLGIFCGTEADLYAGGSLYLNLNPDTGREAAFRVIFTP